MLDSEYRFSSTWFYHSKECRCLKSLFSRLKYPQHLINSLTLTLLLAWGSLTTAIAGLGGIRNDELWRDSGSLIPFKEQDSANFVKTQLKDLSLKLHTTIQTVFVSKKIGQDLHECETKPQVVNQQFVVYHFQCNLCDTGTYVGYTRGHILHAWMATKINHLLCANNTIKTTRVPSLRTFSAALECWKKARTNLRASYMRCFTSNN